MKDFSLVCLIQISAKEGARSHLIEKPSFTIGRTQDSDLPILEPSVSRVHMAIEIKQDQVWITDKHSANGTFINDRRLESGQTLIVLPNDVIKLGSNADEFRFMAIAKPFEMLGTEKKKEDLIQSMESVARQMELKSKERAEKDVRHARAESDQVLAQARKEAEILRTQALMEAQQKKQSAEAELAKLRQESQVVGTEERLRARREADNILASAQKKIQLDFDENAQRIEAQLKEAHDRSLELLEDAEGKARAVLSAARDEASKVRGEAAEHARSVQQETLRKSSEAMAGVQERLQREIAEKKIELLAQARIDAEQERESVLKEFATQRDSLNSQIANLKMQYEGIDAEVAAERQRLEGDFADAKRKLEQQLKSAEDFTKKERDRLSREIADQKATLDEQVELARERAERERDKVMKEISARRQAVEAEIKSGEANVDGLKGELQALTREKMKTGSEIEKLAADLADAKTLLARVEELEQKRDSAERALNEFNASRTEGQSKLERELRELRERGLVEQDAKRKAQEADMAKERLAAMEAVQKFIATEEQKYEQHKKMRALELTEEIYDSLVPRLEGWTKDLASASGQMKTAIGETVTTNLMKSTSSIQSALSAPTEVVSQEVRDRKVKKSLIFAAAVVVVGLFFFGKPLLTKIEESQKNGAVAKELEERRIQSIYNPEQTDDFRGSYVDNVLYMKGYYDTKTDQNYIEKWTLRLNDLNLLRPMELTEEDIIKFVAKETNLVQRLGNARKSIDAVYLKEGLERMRAAEEEDLAEMVKALKGEENFKKLRALEKEFLRDYQKNQKH